MGDDKVNENINSEPLLRLLIIEDVPEDAELIRLALEAENISFSCDVVSTEQDCLNHLSSRDYDGVLSDYRLPGFTGLRTFEILKRSGQEIPFILITGSLGEEAAVECIKAGMTDYVLKDRLFRLPTVLQRALKEFESQRREKGAIAKMQQQAWQEAIISRILQAMRGTLVIDDMLQTTAEAIHEALGVSRCLISQTSPNPQASLRCVGYKMPSMPDSAEPPCALHLHYEQDLKHGIQVSCNSVDETLPPEVYQITQACLIESFLITPLLYQNTYLGAISLHQCDSNRVWEQDEMSLLQVVADHCAIAIHQAELYRNAQVELNERKKMEDKLRHDALHDNLTNLPNRALIVDRLHQALQRYHRHAYHSSPQEPKKFAVLFLDLDRFKVINDSLGHAAGDQLLKTVANRLSKSLRAGDSLARLGGDEFVVLIEEVSEVNDAIEVVHRIHQAIEKPILLNGHKVNVGVSIGIVLSEKHYTGPEQLLRDADTAMYRAKSKQRGSYEVFDPSMHTQVMMQLQMENHLRNALESEELAVYYQPIICLKTYQVHGFEALVRWQSPRKGLIMPSDFLPVAEDTGLILAIDLWVLREACRQLKEWQKLSANTKDLFMSINLSGKHFLNSDLISEIDTVLDELDLDPQSLRMELTENILIERTSTAISTLAQIRARGIKVSLDDFGTGYSSLSYLHRFPINTLKIDRSFISQLEADVGNMEIVKAIIDLGLHLGLDIVAEGVETSEQLQFLVDHRCQYGQGFYFSKPLEARAAAKLIRQETPVAEAL
ncbi:MAG TPA: EAL domain-containing protein [Stenomitos sp.]